MYENSFHIQIHSEVSSFNFNVDLFDYLETLYY